VHPDFHTARATADQAASIELTAALNEAYTTLRDRFTRAEYLLGLEGGPSAAEHKQMDPAFLAEMLEARERLEEVRTAENTCGAGIHELTEEFNIRYNGILAGVETGFAELEALPPNDERRAALRRNIRVNLNAAKYVRGLIRDLNTE
jgi:molecular chaperone HscB